MACLVAPAAAAVVITIIRKKVPSYYHIEWLLWMLWGGTAMLVVDHLISGEMVLYPPFFTAGRDVIWKEILAVGVPMTIVTVIVWGIAVLLARKKSLAAV
jgi:hypothetical protein